MNSPILPGDAVTVLTEEQKDFYRKRFGVRYVGVQANPAVASRRERRARGDRGHNFGLGLMAVPRSR